MRSIVRDVRALSLLAAMAALLASAAQAFGHAAGQDSSAPVETLAQAGETALQPAAPTFDTGDTAWLLTSTALVLMMTIPGLALFYGGLVRAKNVLSTLMHSLFCAALVGVVWVLVGYSLAFGSGEGAMNSWIGGFTHLGLAGVMGTSHPLAPTVPHMLFVAFQMTFAIITPALISGAIAERMRFPAFALFVALWSLVIYAPIAHWVWGGGWIGTQVGALDFAGGTVVHIASGVSALVAAIVLGPRVGYGKEPMPPHNLPFTMMGAGMLWVGWFGFNAGSAVAAGELASLALINTNTAAGAAALAWMAIEMFHRKKATLLGVASGAVAGLVVITPAAGFVTPGSSVLMGLAGGVVCYFAVAAKPKLKYDDALDVVGVHLVGGILGALLTGVFATSKVNSAIETLTLGVSGGVVDGYFGIIWKQGAAVLATLAFCGIGTVVILKLVNLVTPLRADVQGEIQGLDLNQHSERGYIIGQGEAMGIIVAEPRAATAPPIFQDRFAVRIHGVDAAAMMNRWRSLCGERAAAPSQEFTDLYGRLTTIRGMEFNFRGGDRDRTRQTLERLFSDLGPSVAATVVNA
jgi:Amt family ammonium transporter